MEHAGIEKLVVDRNRCEGYGLCQQAAGDLIHLSDEDEPIIDVAEISAAHRPAANAAVRACPVAALSLSGTTDHG
jgi:ferredoxin